LTFTATDVFDTCLDANLEISKNSEQEEEDIEINITSDSSNSSKIEDD
jgi:hypothetical protein